MSASQIPVFMALVTMTSIGTSVNVNQAGLESIVMKVSKICSNFIASSRYFIFLWMRCFLQTLMNASLNPVWMVENVKTGKMDMSAIVDLVGQDPTVSTVSKLALSKLGHYIKKVFEFHVHHPVHEGHSLGQPRQMRKKWPTLGRLIIYLKYFTWQLSPHSSTSTHLKWDMRGGHLKGFIQINWAITKPWVIVTALGGTKRSTSPIIYLWFRILLLLSQGILKSCTPPHCDQKR